MEGAGSTNVLAIAHNELELNTFLAFDETSQFQEHRESVLIDHKGPCKGNTIRRD